jgi:hypothetical protein
LTWYFFYKYKQYFKTKANYLYKLNTYPCCISSFKAESGIKHKHNQNVFHHLGLLGQTYLYKSENT